MSSRRSKPRGKDFMIQKRRAEEDRRAQLEASRREAYVVGERARWENTTHERILRNQAKVVYNRLQEEAKNDLRQRRRDLAAKLEREQKEYESEVENSFETMEDRNKRIAKRALELKALREKEQEKIVQDARYRQFRDSCDELRGKDKYIVQQMINDYNVSQVRRKEEDKAKLQKEADDFAKTWELDRVRKKDREDEELSKRKEYNQVTKRILDEQVELKKKIVEKERREKQEEDAKNIAMWQKEILQAKRAESQRKAEAFGRYQALMHENMKIQEKKASWGDADKAHTKWLIEEAIRKEKEQEAFERAERERKSREARDYQRQLEDQMVKEAKDETELERLRVEDQEKAWRKREQQWAAEKAARDNLMKEVFETRELQLREKEEMRKLEKDMDNMHSKMALDKYENDYRIEREKEDARRSRLKRAQDQLLDQIRANEEQRERERQQEYFAQRSMRKQEEVFNQQLSSMRADEYKPKDFRKKSAKWFS